MGVRYGILLDLTRCIGCEACVVACNTGRELPLEQEYIEIRHEFHGQFPDLTGAFVPHRCYHCADAACVAVCPTGTLFKQYGLTAVDAEKCIACGNCVEVCPFEIPKLVDDRVSKCTGCVNVIEAGQQPWCVRTCPSKALKFGRYKAIFNEALDRVETLVGHFPNAQVYGRTDAGGLGVLMILPDRPTALGLPEDVDTPAVVEAWKQAMGPVSPANSLALSLGFAGLAAIFTRRQKLQRIEFEEPSEGPSDTHKEIFHA